MKAPLGTRLINQCSRAAEFTRCNRYSHEAGRQKDNRIDESNNPLILPFAVDMELFWERQVGAIGSSLIPSLGGGADGAQGD